ncbi:thermonuclease family protein [Rhizobium beringeri]
MRASQIQEFTVTDGDTVHVVGEAAGTRLVGFNTPEKFSPQCEYERQQGERASARLRELVAHGSGRLTKVACACAPGTEGTKKCNHGRYCGTLLVEGKDVGSILISEGLAVPFVCGRTRLPAHASAMVQGIAVAQSPWRAGLLTHFFDRLKFIRWTKYTRRICQTTILIASSDARTRSIWISLLSSTAPLQRVGGRMRSSQRSSSWLTITRSCLLPTPTSKLRC